MLLPNCKLPRITPKAICKISGNPANVICDVCKKTFDSFFTVGLKRVGAAPMVENGRICGICLRGWPHENLLISPESEHLQKNVIAETRAALTLKKKRKNKR
jgi:hypothetical protein